MPKKSANSSNSFKKNFTTQLQSNIWSSFGINLIAILVTSFDAVTLLNIHFLWCIKEYMRSNSVHKFSWWNSYVKPASF